MDMIGAWAELCQVRESVPSIIDLSIDENIIRSASLECHLASASPPSPRASAPAVGSSLPRSSQCWLSGLDSWWPVAGDQQERLRGHCRQLAPQGTRGGTPPSCSGERLGVKSPGAGHVPSLPRLVSPPSPGEPLLRDAWHKGDLEHWEGHALSLNSCPAALCPGGTPDPGSGRSGAAGSHRGGPHTLSPFIGQKGALVPCRRAAGARPALAARVHPGQDQPRALGSPAGSSGTGR